MPTVSLLHVFTVLYSEHCPGHISFYKNYLKDGDILLAGDKSRFIDGCVVQLHAA